MAALRFEVGRSSGVAGNVLVLGFVFDKISAILGKISAILVLGRLASILRRPVVDLGAVWAGRILAPSWAVLGGKLGPSGRLGRVLGPSWAVLGAILAPRWDQKSIKKPIKS